MVNSKMSKLYEDGTKLITKQRTLVLVLKENRKDNGHYTMVVSIAGLNIVLIKLRPNTCQTPRWV